MTTLVEFEDFTTPEMRKRVVDSVFESWGHLSKEACDSIKEAVGPIDGFRPNADVPAGRLKVECNKLSKKFTDFFSEVIMPVWAEANPDLMKLTSGHMQRRPPPSSADKKALGEYCAEQAVALAGQHDQYDRENFLVMVRYCAADTDALLFGDGDREERGSSYAGVTGIGILQFLMWLESLPPDSAEWDGVVPLFAQDLTKLILTKEDECSNLAAFASMLIDVKAAHADTLSFFQADTSEWADSKVAWVESRDTLQKQADSLNNALKEYSEASRPGSNLAEERKLREQRESLEKAIESRIKRINELLKDANPPEQAHRRTTLQEFLDDLNALVEDDADVPEAGPERKAGSDALSNAGETERALEEQLAGLEIENRGLEDEVCRLQRQVTLWRSNYETERQSRDHSEPDPIPTEFISVAHVLEIAERRFADRLVFKFNSASDPDYPYDTPTDVWNALEWLATAYYDSHTGKISIPNLSDSLREVSRFRYTPHQSGTTIGMYPDSYYTRINGHKVLLKEHMGAGIDRSPTNSIRIAFNWDKQSGKVIVGYIGLHQHNRKT